MQSKSKQLLTVMLVGQPSAAGELGISTCHELVYCRQVEDALTMLETGPVDLVIVDMAHEVFAGDCCQRIRAVVKSRVPIVLIGSGNLAGDADELLKPPLQPRDVLELVTDLKLLNCHLDAFRAAKTVRIPLMQVTWSRNVEWTSIRSARGRPSA